jgi:hypothetical protein
VVGPDLCLLSLIASLVANEPGFHFGQEVFYCVLQPLCYNLADMNKLTPNIHEVIAFTK